MVELSHWQEIVVPQRNRVTGCVPTGFEWLIRYQGIQNVDLTRFQEEFDRIANRRGDNSFVSIANEVKQKYPHVSIRVRGFRKAEKKVAFIKSLVRRDIPSLLSIPNYVSLCPCELTFHMVPVVSVDDARIKIIYDANTNSSRTCDLLVSNVICWHNIFKGGNDIAWLPK